MNAVPFTKPPLSLADQVALLKQRGMRIPDPRLAEDTLLRINYYRFSGYALHFEVFQDRQRTHRFRSETGFNAVMDLYEFDTQLRALLFRYIEPVEVAFRAAVCHELSTRTNDSHWYLDPSRYDRQFDFRRMMEACQREYDRSEEIFIKNYKRKYSTPVLPPAWMMSEILSIGHWSKVYKHLPDSGAKKAVAQHFATKPHYLESWIHSLSVLRNLCAHHCRIWNRNFTIKPVLPNSLKPLTISNAKLAALTVVLAHLLKPLGKNLDFQNAWAALLAAFPNVPQGKMGFPAPIQGGARP